ncbi:RES family NAD+ phosphorylase [Rhodopseudomonas palustris]|nr:RES family NAD+ phosphorylase [Rhodopseudomonas palustris]
MELWRISNYADLTGEGGIRASGRWHSRGRRVVYLADHPSSALLEMLVHMDREFLPATFQLLHLTISDRVAVEAVRLDQLPPNWRDRLEISRRFGDHWLEQSTRALLRVPSVIVPQAKNYLLNPAHPEAAEITIDEIIQAPFDPRLIGA